MDGNEIAYLETAFEILIFISNLIQWLKMEWKASERKYYSSTYDSILDPFDAMDRLSNLPGEIIENNIFKHLILQDQTRTSVVFKPWRARWRNFSALIRTFAIEIPESKDSDRVDNVFAFLASKRVENLSLAVANYTIPSQIFDLVHLTELALTG
ncbi:hypothetical protein LINPERPRIM_LOCUS39069 [Linum perenne]